MKCSGRRRWASSDISTRRWDVWARISKYGFHCSVISPLSFVLKGIFRVVVPPASEQADYLFMKQLQFPRLPSINLQCHEGETSVTTRSFITDVFTLHGCRPLIWPSLFLDSSASKRGHCVVTHREWISTITIWFTLVEAKVEQTSSLFRFIWSYRKTVSPTDEAGRPLD